MSADLTFRKQIRAITDSLGPDEWIRLAAIYARLPEPRAITALVIELKSMLDAEMLLRRGKRLLFEYRSGPQPVIDRRTLRKGTKLKKPGAHMGFRELARLAESDPAAFAEHTRNDGAEWRGR